ncbi:cysteine-rich CWC family protein [Stutzerimonas stutzeri]|uniref:Cysteine-rich CWC family protein n=2 Tax=Stutzerimonas stutzeri TaxID=316 RepID=A0ABD4XX98_STUST|nr:cysteine-rich CWC family protein [Stutzerimonas stutzeri]MBW8337880.1 cysteine-rich CWC family protein [Pseudomonas sp.]MDH0082740.1 cysteine-rich CWC family protein [Stutzerimonas stutzeri]MDH0687427.1 cysteine-rich CWC family protein [Stutzerimonas stutzeri]
MSEPVNPSRCPLCGQPNQCAECDPAADQPCWCFTATISQDTLDGIPAALRNRACICPRCARRETAAKT